MNPYLILIFAIVLEVIGTSALRASAGFSKLLPSLVVALGYGGAFYLISKVLTALPLGLTYAIWSGVGTALTALIGWFYFRDAFSSLALLGIALIIAGVVVLNLGGAAHGK
ncbi:multidrug efflux SMR transporter [Deinococcus detaillensis]|uniref:Multidrug efflux SMR transporter n=1 Tax=Deinococcus detaillensis TaxID=2592048 RepID=A0A553V130_9DEIO|nr:multidrug efflux SMR transporter [Deinococcus detaillensis]TSA86125.1 multidrug efflux SMR transporter [Deinococcus detaillensis]